MIIERTCMIVGRDLSAWPHTNGPNPAATQPSTPRALAPPPP